MFLISVWDRGSLLVKWCKKNPTVLELGHELLHMLAYILRLLCLQCLDLVKKKILQDFVFIYFLFELVFIASYRLSLATDSRDYSWLQCTGFSLRCFFYCRAWALGAWASVFVAQGLSCSEACGIFPGQGLNPCTLHWQADSYPLHCQGSLLKKFFLILDHRPYGQKVGYKECFLGHRA